MMMNALDRTIYTLKKKRIVFCLLLIVVVMTVLSFGWGVGPCSAQARITISGVTESINDVTLSAWVDGTISKVFFKEGEAVKKGATILELYKQLEAFEVKRRKLIWKSKVEANAAAQKVKTLGALLEDTRSLFESTGAVSKEELDTKQLEYDLAVAELKQFEISEAREEIEYKIALENLYKRGLRSPIHGFIMELMLEEGEYCEAGQPLARVVDTRKCLLVCHMEERLGRTLKKGQAVDLQIQTGAEKMDKKGTIAFVSKVVDPASGLLKVKAEFNNSDGAIRPGVAGTMFLRSE